MTKTQKIWLWIFLGMFVVPEVLWGLALNAVASILHLPLTSLYTNHQAFNDRPILAYSIMAVELIALIGLFVMNRKFHNKKNLVFSYILVILILFLIGLVYLNYSVSNISFP